MKNILKTIKENTGLIILSVILVYICAANYTPGTWLAGWDNLMPELNITLNIKRSLNAVWQQYQGLGLVGGNAHAADLPRQLILWPMVALLPNNLVRYFWHFLMLFTGTLGMYWGLSKVKGFGQPERFLGALFYLLNFGTVQHFWVPFETFINFWGFFPWLIFSFWQYLEQPSGKNLILLAVINILAIPSFYVPTLFVVYLLCLSAFSLPYLVSLKKDRYLHLLKSGLLILVLNSFWLIPFGYFLATNSFHPRESIINIMSSDEILYRNNLKGTYRDFFLLRGFYYDFSDGPNSLMETWQQYFAQERVVQAGYALAGAALIGLFSFLSSFKNKAGKKLGWGVAGIFLLGMAALVTDQAPFKEANEILRQSPFISQVFRSPFTKFIFPAIFGFSFFLAGFVQIFRSIFKKAYRYLWPLPVAALISLVLISTWPVFNGELFYWRMKVKVPQEYFQMFDYFKKQPANSRIANLPQGSYWGWSFYRWGLRGSGFIWYALEQPVLDRTFDVWNLNNEQYYWELDYALQTKDIKAFERVLSKYSIEFVVFDDHIFYPGEKEYAKLSLKTKELLSESSRLQKVATFGAISVYQFEQPTKIAFVEKPLPGVYPLSFMQADPAYRDLGPYRVDADRPDFYYPFGEMFTNRLQKELKFDITETEFAWRVNRQLPDFIGPDYQLRQNYTWKENIFPVNLPRNQKQIEGILNQSLPVEEFINPRYCSAETDTTMIDFSLFNGQMELRAKEAALCVDWQNYDYFHQFKAPVVIEINFEYQSGSDEWPNFCFGDKNLGCLNDKYLPSKGNSLSWDQYSEKIYFNPKMHEPTSLTFILDATNKKGVKSMRYRNLNVRIYHFYGNYLAREMINNDLMTSENLITVEIPKIDSAWYVGNPVENNLVRLEPEKCNLNLEGPYDREVVTEEGNSFVRLTATNSNSCLNWHFSEQPLKQAWLAEVVSRNIQGFPLLIASYDGYSKYKFFYTRIESTGDWQKSYFVIPHFSEMEKGLAISLNTYSFDNSTSINDIASLRIIPIPWDYLKYLRYERVLPAEERYDLSQTPTLLEADTLNQKGSLWHYRVSLPENKSVSTVILPQSYDRGWTAVSFKGLKPQFYQHSLVNNWANGWEVNERGEDDPQKIYLVFWPQLLEYIGFLIIGFSLLKPVRSIIKRAPKSSK